MKMTGVWRAILAGVFVCAVAAGAGAQNTPTPTLTPWPVPCSIETTWGGLGAGDGLFTDMRQIAIRGDVLYAVDMGNDRIQRFTLSGSSILPHLTAGGTLDQPFGLAVDSAGMVYVSEYNGGQRLLQVDPSTDMPVTLQSGFANYGGVNVDDDGDVYVSVMSHSGPEGARKFRQVTPGNWVQMSSLVGVVDTVNDVLPLGNGVTVYIVDTGNHRIQEFLETPPGSDHYVESRIVVGSMLNNPPGYTVWPHQLTVDSMGFYYLADLANRFQVFDANWNFRYICEAITGNSYGLAVDGSGFIYEGIMSDGTIRRYRSTPMPPPYMSPTPVPPDCGSQLRAPFVYPSPLRPGPGNLSVQLCRSESVKIHIYNAAGGLAGKLEFLGRPGDNVRTYDFSNYSSGVYYFLVEIGGQRQPLGKFAVIN